jgi:hypothetical protein
VQRDQTVEREVTIERLWPSWVGDMNEVERAIVLFESLAKERDTRLKNAEHGSEHHDSITPGSTSKTIQGSAGTSSETTQVASTSVAEIQAERRLFRTDAERRAFLTEYPESPQP